MPLKFSIIDTVTCLYNMVQYNTVLNTALQKTPSNSHSQVSYGLPVVSTLEETDRDITALHCMMLIFCYLPCLINHIPWVVSPIHIHCWVSLIDPCRPPSHPLAVARAPVPAPPPQWTLRIWTSWPALRSPPTGAQPTVASVGSAPVRKQKTKKRKM